VAGADFLAALEANYFLGALAPVDFLAVYLVLAIVFKYLMNLINVEILFDLFLNILK
jgi:hypothetical protein